MTQDPNPTAIETVPTEGSTFPREGDHLAPRPWVTTVLALVVFCIPGAFCTLATVIGDEWDVAAGCAAWTMIGGGWLWFAWSQRRKFSHAAFCEAMDKQPIVAILKRLEDEDLDVEEAVDIMEYLRLQRRGWSLTLTQTVPETQVPDAQA